MLARVDDPLLPARMRVSLRRCDEAGAEPRSRRSECERGGEPAAVGDTARRHHRHRRDGVDHGRDQRERRDLAPDVTSGLAALRDDAIDAEVDDAACLGGGRHRVQQAHTGGVADGDVRRRVAPAQADHRDAAVDADLQALGLVPVQHEVHAERPRGRGAHARDRSASCAGSSHVPASMPRPPASQTAATSSTEVVEPSGACTIGSSQPTSAQKGVCRFFTPAEDT